MSIKENMNYEVKQKGVIKVPNLQLETNLTTNKHTNSSSSNSRSESAESS